MGDKRQANTYAHRFLVVATQGWFATLVLGSLIFTSYMFGFYGYAVAQGEIELWNQRLFHGIIDGDLLGNVMIGLHLAMASVVSIGGPIQFVRKIRLHYPRFHRLFGWIYISSAFVIAGGGLYLVLARGGVSLTGDISLGLSGLLILFFAAFALHSVIARDFAAHRRWALRLFITMNSFLFARAGFQAWIFLMSGIGHTNTYTGWFDIAWGFSNYMLPLMMLEIYLKISRSRKPIWEAAFAFALLVSASILALGIFLAAKNLWLPAIGI